jgi:hypothetical protein
MPFENFRAANQRLEENSAELTPTEVRDLMPHLANLSVASLKRLDAELSLQNLEAVQKFEESSSELTCWLIRLTVALAGMTLALVLMTAVLVYLTWKLVPADTRIESPQGMTHDTEWSGPRF